MDYDSGPDVHALPASSTDTPPAPIEYKMVEDLDTDFKRKYPPDLPGREMEDGARVWMVYRDEATANDSTIIDGWSKTIDILLIFAGLFSAVATAFVIESYKLLQLDSEAYTANALYLILNSTSSSPSLPALPLPPGLDTSPSSLSRWINGLWFTSLILSLAVALLCILVKQWIGEYTARNNASARSPRHWARRHQVYFQAMSRWPVAEFVSVLPLLLHLALFLFFAGTVAFLWTLDRAISVMVIVLGSTLTAFYAVCTFIPLWIPDCPTSTPLANQIRRQLLFLRRNVQQLRRSLAFAARRIREAAELYYERWTRLWQRTVEAETASESSHRSFTYFDPAAGRAYRVIGNPRPSDVPRGVPRTESASTDQPARENSASTSPAHSWDHGTPDALFITRYINRNEDALDHDALMWLILAVSDTDANAVGLQALGALKPTSSLAKRIRYDRRLRDMTVANAAMRTSVTVTANELMRMVRSQLCTQRTGCMLYEISKWPILNTLIDPQHPDLCLLWSMLHPEYLPAVRASASSWRNTSPSLTSTALLLLRSHDPLRISDESQRYSCELHCLLCCRFEDMSDEQWKLMFHSLRTITSPRPPPIMREVWLLNTVARLVERVQKDENGIQTGSMIIERLLDMIADKISQDDLDGNVFYPKFLAVGRLLDLPHMTASLCGRQRRLDLNLTRSVAIVHVLLGGTDKTQLHFVNTLKYFGALAGILHRPFSRKEDAEPVLDLVARACYEGFPVDPDEELAFDSAMSGTAHQALALRDDRTRMSVVLEHILRPLDVTGMPSKTRPTIWEALWGNLCTHNWIKLVERVVSSLCIHQRNGRDTLDMVDIFFATFDFPTLISVWITTFGHTWLRLHEDIYHAPESFEETYDRFVKALKAPLTEPHPDLSLMMHIIQHCIELRPLWWIELLGSVTPENPVLGVNVDRICAIANILHERLATQGPCTTCAGVPLDWANEFEDDDGDGDCFYPTISQAATAHLPRFSPIRRESRDPMRMLRYIFE